MKLYSYLTIVTLLAGCAQQTQPTGGPKDVTPPVLLSSDPAQGATGFKGSQIDLVFSESVQLNKPKEEIIVTPAVKEIQAVAKRNRVTIFFTSALADSTTYTLNFREAVQDINERNTTTNLKISFSTGPYLDSLSVSGYVFDALTKQPINDVTVALHPKSDTFSMLKHKASIFTKANAKGEFLIENLKAGLFHVYAFTDKNKNRIVDSRTERFGFIAEPVNVKEGLTSLEIPLVSLDMRPVKLISARPVQNYFGIKTNKGIQRAEITYINSGKAIVAQGGDDNTVRIYKSFLQDSLLARVILYDSIENKIDTTLYVRFNSANGLKLDKFTTQLISSGISSNSGVLNALIKFNKPLKRMNFDSIYFRADSSTITLFESTDIKLDSQQLLLRIQKRVSLVKTEATALENIHTKASSEKGQGKKLNTVYNELILAKSAFISVDNDSSVQIKEKVSVHTEATTATINVSVDTNNKSCITQLLNAQGKITQEITGVKPFSFENVMPGEYKIRVIEDQNKNGKWDAGNYFLYMEPEPIHYYYSEETKSDKFFVKANWEYGPLLISTDKRVDKKRVNVNIQK